MPTVSQDRDFVESVISHSLLDDAISWIRNSLYPENVFDELQLKQWASERGCGEVFDEKELIEWAENNGYALKEEE